MVLFFISKSNCHQLAECQKVFSFIFAGLFFADRSGTWQGGVDPSGERLGLAGGFASHASGFGAHHGIEDFSETVWTVHFFGWVVGWVMGWVVHSASCRLMRSSQVVATRCRQGVTGGGTGAHWLMILSCVFHTPHPHRYLRKIVKGSTRVMVHLPRPPQSEQ
jgi:hypothetical protein